MGVWRFVGDRTDAEFYFCHPREMETNSEFHIVSAERMNSGVLIEFSDNRWALYTPELLSKFFSEAETVPLDPDD